MDGRMKKLLAFGSALVLMAVVAGGYLWTPAHDAVRLTATKLGLPSAMNVLTERERMPSATVATAPAAPLAPSQEMTKSQRFDELLKSDKPADKYAAVRLLTPCLSATRSTVAQPAVRAHWCGDLTAGQLTQAYPLLKQAAEAHIPGAAPALWRTTPDGTDPYKVRNDPAYAAWNADAVQSVNDAARFGDPEAMLMVAEWSSKKNPEEAIAWVTAANDSYMKTYKNGGSPEKRANLDDMSRAYERGVAPDKVASAIAAGHAIAGGQK